MNILRKIAQKTPKKLRYFILIDSWAKYTVYYPKKEVTSCSIDEVVKHFEKTNQ